MGNKEYVLEKVKKFDLGDQVSFLDFVSNDDLFHLYKNTRALLMPTYFGPTNIPPIEAVEMNIPIIYSDDKYVKEQFQNATYKLDLDNVDSLVDVLLKFATNKENTEEKLKHYEKIKLKLSCAKNFEILETMINEFMNKKGDSWKIMMKSIHKIKNVWIPGSNGMVAKCLISKLKKKKINYKATNRANLDLTNYKESR